MKKEKKINKIRFNELTNIQKIMILICCILVIIAIMAIGNMVSVKEEMNYKNVTPEFLIEEGTPTYNREVYWDLNDIISEFIYSYRYQEDKDTNEYTPLEYYESLTNAYRSYLGKSKYKTVVDAFLQKFINQSGEEQSMKVEQTIANIYDLGENSYFCELTGMEEKIAYIGINLDVEKNTFQIFYLQ